MKVEALRDQDTGLVAIHEIDNAARCAAMRSWSQMLPMDDRYLLAWEAIGVAVSQLRKRIPFNEMIQVGIDAIDLESRDWLRHHGRNNTRSFEAFWMDWVQAESLFEEELCQRIALAQVLAVLPDRMRRALMALVIADDLQGAADHLGQHYDTVAKNVRDARAFIYSLWWGEEAAPSVRRDRRVSSYATKDQQFCKQGHELTPENSYRIGISQRCCRECQINRQRKRRAEQKARKRAQTNSVVAERNRRHGGVQRSIR